MSYSTPEKVKSLFRDIVESVDPAVTDAEIQEFLDDASAIIDAKIGTLYVLPITEIDNPKSFAILKRLETFKVACIVDDILNSYGEADKKPMWCQRAKELMKALVPDKEDCVQCEPNMKLPDATYKGTSRQRSRISIGATSGTVFKKGENNW